MIHESLLPFTIPTTMEGLKVTVFSGIMTTHTHFDETDSACILLPCSKVMTFPGAYSVQSLCCLMIDFQVYSRSLDYGYLICFCIVVLLLSLYF
jgi:hypothetical protein